MRKTKRLTVRIPRELNEELQKQIRELNYSGSSELVKLALREFVDRRKSIKVSFRLKKPKKSH